MHGLSGFQHYKVGDVNNIVNGAHTALFKGVAQPFGRWRNFNVFNHRAHITRTKVVVFNLYADIIVNVVALFCKRGSGQLKGFVKHRRRFAGNTYNALAVGTVGGNFEVDNIVVKPQNIAHIGAGGVAVVHNHNAVDLGVFEVSRRKSQFAARTQHTAAFNTAKFTLGNFGAAWKQRFIFGDRYGGALKNVLRAGNYLYGALADVHLANLQMVGVFVRGNFCDFANHHVLHGLRKVGHFLNLKADHYHFFGKYGGGDVYINVIFK